MPLPDVVVEPVRDQRALREFVLLPWRVYRGDPHWVPPLISDMMKMLDRSKHPFHEHAEVEYFVARRGARGDGVANGHSGEVVGRIAAIVNRAHNEFHDERTGFVGFFETLDDPSVPPLLFQAAARWLSERGMERMRGPANFSSNEEWGMLIDGFDDRPRVMMTYNPRSYPRHWDDFGFTKAKDLVAYWFPAEVQAPARLVEFVEKLESAHEIRIRPMDLKRFDAEVDLVRDLYNQAWERNWGFVPMTHAEIDHMAKELKPVVDPDLVLFAELQGQPVGFALALPDAYQALQKANGRLFPFGLIRILLESKRIHVTRVLTLGVVKEHRRRGIDSMLYYRLYQNCRRKGYPAGEFSWILEDNVAIRRPLERLGAYVYKTYRIYDYPLG